MKRLLYMGAFIMSLVSSSFEGRTHVRQVSLLVSGANELELVKPKQLRQPNGTVSSDLTLAIQNTSKGWNVRPVRAPGLSTPRDALFLPRGSGRKARGGAQRTLVGGTGFATPRGAGYKAKPQPKKGVTRQPGKNKVRRPAHTREADTQVTLQVVLDVGVGEGDSKFILGSIWLGLYGQTVPKTVENFRALCTGEEGISRKSDKALTYVGSRFHRIIPGFLVQGGDIINGHGSGGESIYEGGLFEDENFKVKHDRVGLISMSNTGPDCNGSEFFITVSKAPWLDGQHVVFGQVDQGMEVVKAVESFGRSSGKPQTEITIKACRVIGPPRPS